MDQYPECQRCTTRHPGQRKMEKHGRQHACARHLRERETHIDLGFWSLEVHTWSLWSPDFQVRTSSLESGLGAWSPESRLKSLAYSPEMHGTPDLGVQYRVPTWCLVESRLLRPDLEVWILDLDSRFRVQTWKSIESRLLVVFYS